MIEMVHKCLQYGVLMTLLLILLPALALAGPENETSGEIKNQTLEFSAGYRSVNTSGQPNRATEYNYLDDSPTFNLVVKQLTDHKSFSLIGDYINKNDYYLEGDFDYKGLVRLNARTEKLYHNLDHIPYQNSQEARPPVTGEVSYRDDQPQQDYNRRVTFDEVKLRGKLPTYPGHLNLSYWRMEKKGKQQLRFAQENCANACHIQSRTMNVDRVTEEFKVGIDAHIGPVDVAFLQTLREFREKSATPVDNFGGTLWMAPGDYLHDETPDAKLTESSFMINLPTSGGFVSSASYTFGKRESESDLSVVSPVDAETEYQKLSADATYTPGEKWTFNFRYRMLDLDSDVPSTQVSDGASSFNGEIPVRDSIDIDRDNYAAYVSYRPTHHLTIKGEFEREDIRRSNTGVGRHDTFSGISDAVWYLPENETIDRYRLSFSSKLLEKSALKLNGWYEYRDDSDPAYSTSLNKRHELFFNVNYRPSTFWGATGSIDILRGKNDKYTAIQFNNSWVPYDLDRDEERESLAFGLWIIPNEIFSADLNYGLLHSRIDQDVLFGENPDPNAPLGPTDFTILDNNADYTQRTHTLSAGINLRLPKEVSCRMEGYYINSSAKFSPGFSARDLDYTTGTASANPEGLEEMSEIDLRQKGVKARINWPLSDVLTAIVAYTFDDYDDVNSNVYDGSVQTVTASLSGAF
jgi:hypothetical protein